MAVYSIFCVELRRVGYFYFGFSGKKYVLTCANAWECTPFVSFACRVGMENLNASLGFIVWADGADGDSTFTMLKLILELVMVFRSGIPCL